MASQSILWSVNGLSRKPTGLVTGSHPVISNPGKGRCNPAHRPSTNFHWLMPFHQLCQFSLWHAAMPWTYFEAPHWLFRHEKGATLQM
jgi:hypothetical protein